MEVQALVHLAPEGGYWAEVPAIPGCATQGETLEELRENLIDAIRGCLAVQVDVPETEEDIQVLAIAV